MISEFSQRLKCDIAIAVRAHAEPVAANWLRPSALREVVRHLLFASRKARTESRSDFGFGGRRGLGRAGLRLFPSSRSSREIARRRPRFGYGLQQSWRRQQRLQLVLFLAGEFSREWGYVLVGSVGGGSSEVVGSSD